MPRFFFTALAAGLLHATLCHAASEWQTLKNCRLVQSDYNDGDSFHVEHEGREYIFRLYFVDTPETSLQVPERVAEQAAEFGVSEREILKAGAASAAFSLKHLKRPFSVLTKFEDAKGSSRIPRNYAVVWPSGSPGKDLAELLAEAGWARANGMRIRIPGAPSLDELKRKVEHARRGKMGIFGGNKPAPKSGNAQASRLPVRSSLPTSVPETDIPVANAPDIAVMDGITDSMGSLFEDPLTESPSPRTPPAPESSEPRKSPPGKININSATLAELAQLPGIGEKTARGIIECRPYSTLEDIQRVPNIGPVTYDRIKKLIDVTP